MKLTITREALLRALKAAFPATDQRGTLPILSHILLEYTVPPVLTVTATDMESQYHAVAATDDSGTAGAVCAPAKKLADIVRLLPDGADLDLDHDGAKLRVRSGRSRFQIATLPIEGFPAFDSGDVLHTLVIEPAVLRRALDAVAPASGISDVRYYLNGTLLRVTGNDLTVVASDGHRLARYIIQGIAPYEGRLEAIVPRKSALAIAKALHEETHSVRLMLGSRTVSVALATDTLSARTVEARYAEFERVLPASFTLTAECGRSELTHALQRIGTLSADSRAAKLVFGDDQIRLEAANREHEQANEEIDAELDGEPITLGWNLDYLLAALGQVTSDKARLQIGDSGACVMTDASDPGYLALVSGMRL